MKERPILMSASMVRAILDGRKTETRRILKTQPEANFIGDEIRSVQLLANGNFGAFDDCGLTGCGEWKCPYGQPGDRLWVKETFCVAESPEGEKCYAYRADNWTECPSENGKWMPSIFCRRVASRITLEITAVRVERLNDISEADAKAEGCEFDAWSYPQSFTPGKSSYRALWESINGSESWAKNPWVWVIAFKRITP